MINVVIICHDFPPLNSVASFRPEYWMKNFHKNGVYPIVFTNNWSENINVHRDKFSENPLDNSHIKNSKWELFKISSNKTWRSKLISKYGFEKHVLLRRLLTLLNWYKYFFTVKSDEYAPLFKSIDSYLKKNKIDFIIVSGGPFHFFKYGWHFNNTYKIPWIADYRDEWHNNQSNLEIDKQSLFLSIERRIEKKWTSNVELFTTVSEGLRKRIADQILKKGIVIRNGFNEDTIPQGITPNKDVFKICFGGTIYQAGYIDILEEGIRLFNASTQKATNIKFIFIGIDLNETEGTKRIHALKDKFPKWIEVIPPVSHKECMFIMSEASVLLSLIIGEISNGTLSTKINDYLALKNPIINIESGSEKESHEFSKYLIECRNPVELSEELMKLYSKWKKGEKLKIDINDTELQKYNRAYHTEKFANLLVNITSRNEVH